MVETKLVRAKLMAYSPEGEQTPHGTSFPVIRKEDDQYYLASFLFFYTRAELGSWKICRPAAWVIADLDSGDVIEYRPASDNDFSDADYDVKYDVRASGQYDTSAEYYDNAFALLDSVRSKLINGDKLPRDEYKKYMNMILAHTPKEYQRFYADLSI